tara:strand:+ start:6631 stop:6939 length:309 start_codon:yes stop_codon:yes gene_type:complete
VAGLTQVDISQLQSLVKHPKWVWVDGLLCFPYFKSTQRVRVKSGNNECWLPALDDPLTLAYLHHLYALNNGAIKKDGELWVSSHRVMGNDLADVLVESFLKL